MAYDAVLSSSAHLFLNQLTGPERQDCRNTILHSLCGEVQPEDNVTRNAGFPYRPEVMERVVGQWHFWYTFLNNQTIGIARIYYSTSNPKHPFRPL